MKLIPCCARWMLMLGMLSLPIGIGAAAEAATATAGTNACAARLRLIWEAIQSYRKLHHDLPVRLSDLAPHHIPLDPLRCPEADGRGPNPDDPKTTYTYEFRTNLLPSSAHAPAGRTVREWKRRQMGLLGGSVPLVRCFGHGPLLNLGFDRSIYQSGLDWEANFADVVPVDELRPGRLFADVLSPQFLPIPIRAADTPELLLDLDSFYNASLSRSWCSTDAGKHLGRLPKGRHSFAGGITFDVRGLIQLQASHPGVVAFPATVSGIPIGRPCARLHFLHGVVNAAKSNSVVGHYRIHYTDGATNSCILRYGLELWNWDSQRPAEFKPAPGTVVAWEDTYTPAKPPARSLRLTQTVWENPRPGVVIRSLDLISAGTDAGPFVVAITVQP